MSSSAQIVTRALKRLNIIQPAESPSAEEAADGLAALNAMIAGWQADGINVSADVPLPSMHEEGVVALLAVRLASDYGKEPSALLLLDASTGMRRLEGAYISAPLAAFDTALTSSPSRPQTFVTTVDDWVASTAYDAGDRVLADDRMLYECIVAGTSASSGSGPHDTGANITDGTVTWRWVGYAN